MLITALALAAVGEIHLAKPPHPLNMEEWFTAEDYPHAAREKEAEGAVEFSMLVDTSGSALDCRIERSSGVSELDTATCRLAMARARFTPALNTSGRSIAARYRRGMKWTLQAWQPIALESWSHVIDVLLSPNGAVLSCAAEKQGRVPDRLGLKCPAISTSAGSEPASRTDERVLTRSLQFMVSVDGEPPFSARHEERGRTLIGLVVEHFDVSDGGKAENCRVVERHGESPPDTDFCRHLLGPYQPPRNDTDRGKRRSGTILWARSVLLPDADAPDHIRGGESR